MTILSGTVFWCYESEVLNRTKAETFFSFMGPNIFHKHEGIILTREGIVIKGDENLSIPLSAIRKLYVGFDLSYPKTLVKNFGLFWQPLRITLQNEENLYLIIDYSFYRSDNVLWFNTLKQLLSE